MTKINLLPWREERRQELKQQFFVVLFGVLLIGAGSVYLVDMGVQTRIEYQNQRNQFIVGETQETGAANQGNRGTQEKAGIPHRAYEGHPGPAG